MHLTSSQGSRVEFEKLAKQNLRKSHVFATWPCGNDAIITCNVKLVLAGLPTLVAAGLVGDAIKPNAYHRNSGKTSGI